MKLITFQVLNFRSVNDSGPIDVGEVTTLVGRNESGKSNLLIALQSLNPPGKPRDLSPIKDFPRHRRLSECTATTQVLHTTWELLPLEQAHLKKEFPRAANVKQVRIGRFYKAGNWVAFDGLAPLNVDTKSANGRLRKVSAATESIAGKLELAPKEALAKAVKQFEAALQDDADLKSWATAMRPAIAAFRKAIGASGAKLSKKDGKCLDDFDRLAADIAGDDEAHEKARQLVLSWLPIFVYVEDYPELSGHQHLAEYLKRKAEGQLKGADENFEKMCKVADLKPEQLEELLGKRDHETRNQLANRAGAVVTGEIRRLWKDRPLKIRFNPDEHHLDTFVSDPNAVYDVEVNLDERSRGFKWFFSFYVTFAADTKGGLADKAILLLDEPGLHLHATSQSDLLNHLAQDFKNQIIYTTHSPFMVPTDNLDAVRTVNIDQHSGTVVTNEPAGDARTLFPLQAALGYNLAQSLFVGPSNLVVEGVTDYWVLSSISDYLRSVGQPALSKDLTLTPAGGAQKIPYMVALLASERLNVMVLFDDERQSRATKDELVQNKLIRDDGVVFVTEGFDPRPAEADTEDLLEPDVFERLVQQSYVKELNGKTLTLNPKIPRIVKRYEQAFADLGLELHKTRPARLLLNLMATDPTKVMTALSTERFCRLFQRIEGLYQKRKARDTRPFG